VQNQARYSGCEGRMEEKHLKPFICLMSFMVEKMWKGRVLTAGKT